MTRKPRTGGGEEPPRPGTPSAHRAGKPKGAPKGGARPPVRDLDHLEIEEAHAHGDALTDLVLDEDDELTQWQNDPAKAPIHKVDEVDLSLSADGDDLLDLEDDVEIPPARGGATIRSPYESVSTDDSQDDGTDSLLSEDPEWGKPGAGPAGPARAEPTTPTPAASVPQVPLVNPFGGGAESAGPEVYFDHTIDPDGESVDLDETSLGGGVDLDEDDDLLDIEGDDGLLDIEGEDDGLPQWRNEEAAAGRGARMDLVHVSLDPDDPETGLSIDDDMETDLLDLTPMGGSHDELDRLESEVERLEDEDRLDEALSALRQLLHFMPHDGDLQDRYEGLQQRVIQSYFPGKDRNSVVHLAVAPQDLPELIKNAEAELGSLLGRMDGATPLGDLDSALGDMEPGTLYRLLSRAKGKGLVRLD